eukprot:jgi/Psemu1/54254/gm1.54254_g
MVRGGAEITEGIDGRTCEGRSDSMTGCRQRNVVGAVEIFRMTRRERGIGGVVS